MSFGKSETRIDQNGKVFCRITSIFGAVKQRAVGDGPPLKESPGRVPAAGEIFFIIDQNSVEFLLEIIIIL